MRSAAVAALAIVQMAAMPQPGAVAADPPAALQPVPLFEWTVPARYGDTAGPQVETDPETVRSGPWKVRLQVNSAWCREDAAYHWAVRDRPLRPRRLAGCAFEATFPAEGTSQVSLKTRIDGRPLSDTQPVTVQDWLIVSLGDSVASGEAVPDRPHALNAGWQSPRCHRSARAAPAKAAREIEQQDDHSSVTFIHLACSGATIGHGLLGDYDGVLRPRRGQGTRPLPPQVSVLNRIAKRRQVDAVLVSVGANDVYFGKVVRYCALHPARNCFEKPLPDGGGPTIDAAVSEALRGLGGDYGRVARAITPRIAPARVHIVDYFDPTRDAHGNTCPTIFGFVTARELGLAQSRILEPLNEAVAHTEDQNGWDTVTGLADRFRTHGYCARSQAWVTSLSGSLGRLGGQVQQRFLGTLHPNEAGQEAIAAEIADALWASLYPGQALRPRAPIPPAEEDDGLSAAAIALISLGGVLVLLAAGLIGWRLGRARPRPNS
jgi:GDSL-like lipase/acylhydrolase family protein